MQDLVGAYANVIDDIKEMNASGDIIVVRTVPPCNATLASHTHSRTNTDGKRALCSPQMRGVIRREIEGGGHAEETVEIVFPGKHRIPVNVDTDIVDLYRYLSLRPHFQTGRHRIPAP